MQKKANGIDREQKFGSLHFKAKFPGGGMSPGKSEAIAEHEMPGMREDIHKEGTYNKYGDSYGEIESASIEKHDTFISVLSSGPQEAFSVIEG